MSRSSAIITILAIFASSLGSLAEIKSVGLDAKLSESGYQLVANQSNDEEMKLFISRLIKKNQLQVVDDDAFNGFVPFYSGTQSVQDFAKLQKELLVAKWVKKYTKNTEKTSTNASDTTVKKAVVQEHDSAASQNLRGTKESLKEDTKAAMEDSKDGKEAVSKKATATAPVEEPHKKAKLAFPLPAVDSVLTHASNTLNDFAAQAVELQGRVAKQQEASRAALSAKKASFEQKLAEQAKDEKSLQLKMEKVHKTLDELSEMNTDLAKTATRLQSGNMVLRDALTNLKNKASLATEFLGVSLNATDESEAEELKVLASTTQKPTLEYFLTLARNEIHNKNDVSLLSTASETTSLNSTAKAAATPEVIVSMLSQSLVNLEAAEKQGEVQLEASFKKLSEVHDRRRLELQTALDSLEKAKTEAAARQEQLISAKTHLEDTRSQLQVRLRGFSVFAKKVNSAIADTLSAAGMEGNGASESSL